MKQKTSREQQPEQAELNQTKAKLEASTKRFSDHVSELRKRAFFVAIVFILASGIAYNYHDFFVSLIMQPLGQQKLIYLTPGGGFNFIFQISLYAGLLAAAPMLIYQLYGFIKPALPMRARRSATKVVAAAFLLMICGVCYGYFVAVPSALHFLSNFAGTAITPNLTADSYLNFFLAYIAGLGVLFELPLLLLFFHWIRPMTPGGLLKSERFIIVFAFIISAIITPTPDVFNQCMIAIPLLVIYQGGVVAVLFAIRKQRRADARAIKTEPSKREELKVVKENTPVTVVQPRSLPVKQQAPAPTAPHRMVRRPSVDGFSRAASRQSLAVPRRPQAPTMRSATPKPQYMRPRLSVDGFFS